jgi:hypothetical protein
MVRAADVVAPSGAALFSTIDSDGEGSDGMALEAFDLHRMTVKDHERSGAAFRTSEVRGGVGDAQAMHQGLIVVDGR